LIDLFGPSGLEGLFFAAAVISVLTPHHSRFQSVETASVFANRFLARFAAVARLYRAKAAQQAATLSGPAAIGGYTEAMTAAELRVDKILSILEDASLLQSRSRPLRRGGAPAPRQGGSAGGYA